jgi:hypothetical protein
MTSISRPFALSLATFVAFALALSVSLVSAPSAFAACGKTWTGGTGNFNDPNLWSPAGAPTLTDSVCIPMGTAVVTHIPNVGDHAGAAALTLGDGNTTNGGATLQIVGANRTESDHVALDEVLRLTGDASVLADGTMELTSSGPAPVGRGILTMDGGTTLTNAGTLRTTVGAGGKPLDFRPPTLINQAGGVIDVQADSCACFGGAWTNNGTFNIANGKEFEFTGSGGGGTFNLAGGSINTGTSGRFIQTNGIFNHTGGSQSGAPIEICSAQLNPSAGGTAAFDFTRYETRCNGGQLVGDIDADATVRLNNTSPNTNTISLSQAITNNGTLKMIGTAEDQLVSNSITNNGLLETGGTGARQFQIGLTNSAAGTININTSAYQASSTTWTNAGAFNVATGQSFSMSGTGQGPTFDLATGGTLALPGTADFLMPGGTFKRTGGTTSGNPVRVCAAQLDPGSDAGTAKFDFVRLPGTCDGGAITGNIGANTTVRVNNTSPAADNITLTSNITNNGTLKLLGTAEIQLVSNGLTNNGTFESAGTGNRFLQIALTNNAAGTININNSTGTNGSWTNAGTFNVANGQSFGTSGNFTLSGGTINSAGTGFFVKVCCGTFNHTGGGTTGSPVQICGAVLNPAGGAAAATFDIVRIPATCEGGGLSGDIGANETVRVNNTNGNALLLNFGPITNNGTLKLVGTGEDQLVGGPLTNNGTLETSGSGNRWMPIHLTNSATGTVNLLLSAGSNGNWVTSGTFKLAAGQSFGSSTFEVAGGTTTVDGTLTPGNPITVSGGTLGGSGTIGVNVNNTGGTVAPGNSPGILTINGNYTQGPGGTLAAEVSGNDPGTGYDQLAVSGTATLDGTLAVNASGLFTPGAALRVLTAAARSGTFANVTGASRFNLTYGAADVTLTVVDADGDGVQDASDACPTQPAQTADGCPAVPEPTPTPTPTPTPQPQPQPLPGPDPAACDAAHAKLDKAKAKLKKLKQHDASKQAIKKAKKKVKKAKEAVAEACG